MSEPTRFVSDPSSKFVGTCEISRDIFNELPDHPSQRVTNIHAVSLMGARVLEKPLDIHREVRALLRGNIESMEAAFKANPTDALQRYGCKLDGHTRNFLWRGKLSSAPETVRILTYAAESKHAAVQIYNAVDSLASVKAKKDVMQSTLNVAGINPSSELLRKATSLAPALDLACGVLFGSLDFKARNLRAVSTDGETTEQGQVHDLLPHLAAVQLFRDAIVALDGLNPASKVMPVLPPAFLASYLSMLHRDRERAHMFLRQLQEESGEYSGGLMDAFYAIRKVSEHLNESKRKKSSSPAMRTQHIINCALNCYEGWAVHREAYRADNFQALFRTNAIQRFNPILRSLADDMQQEKNAQRVAAKEQRVAKLAEYRARRAQAAELAVPVQL